ncbi:MAG TPA: MFS transporter [Candidatus Elarobacter sp.]|nr:MFS transporter [Candidatus Elarobacter sp.]
MHAFRLGAFWFGIQVIWTSILGVVIQDRVSALAPHAVNVVSIFVASGALIAIVVQIVAGIRSDRRRAVVGDRRVFYRTGVLVATPAIVLLPVVPSLALLWLTFAVLQLGMNTAGGPYQGIVGDYVEPERVGRASSVMSVHQFSGSVVGLLLTILLHGAALGVALAICLVGSWWVTDSYVARLPRSRAAAEPLQIDRNMRIVVLSRAFIHIGFYTLFFYLFFFVQESLGVKDARTTTGILFLAFTVAGIAGAAVAGRPADRLDKRVVISIACLAIAIAVGAFAFAPTVPVAVVCAICSGAAWGAFFTADWAIAYAVLPRAALASAMGVWNLAVAIPQVIAPIITAPVVNYFDAQSKGLGPRIALICVIVEFALGTAWLWQLRLSRAPSRAE